MTPELADEVRQRHGVEALVLPDRPRDDLGSAPPPMTWSEIEAKLGLPPLDPRRQWRLLVSPTSWTLDEDMTLALEALGALTIPKDLGLLLVASGDGPGRRRFEARAATLERPGLRVATGWLAPADYRRLLCRADVGLSLHRSASGLDFPMKLVDMAGAGLPLLALDYGAPLRRGLDALGGGTTFTDAAGMTARLQALLDGSAIPPSRRPAIVGWSDMWRRTALPALTGMLS